MNNFKINEQNNSKYFISLIFNLLFYIIIVCFIFFQEFESFFKILGVFVNFVLYNIVKVVVFFAFFVVLIEICGFKLKFYKIKLKGQFDVCLLVLVNYKWMAVNG